MKQKGLIIRYLSSSQSMLAGAHLPMDLRLKVDTMADQQPCRAQGTGITESARIAETANIMA